MLNLVQNYLSDLRELEEGQTDIWNAFSKFTGLTPRKIPRAIASIPCSNLATAKEELKKTYASRKSIKARPEHEKYLVTKHRLLVEKTQLKQKYYDKLADDFGFPLTANEFELFMETCNNLQNMGVLSEDLIRSILEKISANHAKKKEILNAASNFEGEPIEILAQIVKMCRDRGVCIDELQLPPQLARLLRFNRAA